MLRSATSSSSASTSPPARTSAGSTTTRTRPSTSTFSRRARPRRGIQPRGVGRRRRAGRLLPTLGLRSGSHEGEEMRVFWYSARRLLYVVPQVVGISVVTFVIVRLLPSNPAYALAGPAATQETINTIEKRLGLNEPIWTQYGKYIRDLAQGDFGNSFVSGRPVLSDIGDRLPATLELLALGLLLAFLIGVPLGVLSALGRGRRIAGRASLGYGLLAGAIPDFWLGLILVYLLYTKLNIAPAPLGQLGSEVAAPRHVTGAVALDALITGDWAALSSALGHLVLPLITLVFVYMAPIVKFTRSSIEDVYYGAEFIEQYRVNGL